MLDWSNIDPSWQPFFDAEQNRLNTIAEAIPVAPGASRGIAPAPANIFRAFRMPLETIRVLIVGQDPYPTPGHAIGLAFATSRETNPLPRSLKNIMLERHADLGIPVSNNGDLGAWQEQGVMLLNRVLTVSVGEAGSHRGLGWEGFTEAAIKYLVRHGKPGVAILWGNDAARLEPMLGETLVIKSAHPSPLSANRGFFGSRPFSRANEFLERVSQEPIDWRN